jgi:hypothetical protein
VNESIESRNDLNLATNLTVLANIYHNCGDDIQALEFSQMGAYPIGTFCITRFAHIGSFNQQYCNNAG